jgi:hypothetical protein
VILLPDDPLHPPANPGDTQHPNAPEIELETLIADSYRRDMAAGFD